MLYEKIEEAKAALKEAESAYKRAKVLVRQRENEVALAEKAYLSSFNLSLDVYSRHDPFDDEWMIMYKGKQLARYTSREMCFEVVRMSELAGTLEGA